jgi:spermidine/putrescine transport system ATP-binding protein
MKAVEIKNLKKCFGDVTAVDSVSFDIEAGEFFSLLGPSGCGKTTLLRMLAGLDFPDSGEICIEGKDVTYASAYARPTNLVFQHLALFPHMTIYDNIAFGLKMNKVDKVEIRKRITEVLQLVALENMENRRPSQLSGGQQQRVAIARALVNRPKVLLFDEPLGALDLKLRLQLQTELKELQRKSGTTFVYVTHDQGEALTMSDRIAVMKNGTIYQIGTPYEIYSKPANTFVAGFIGDANLFEITLISAKDMVSVVETSTGLTMKTKANNLEVGTKLRASVRQELVKIGKSAVGLGNCYQAKVIDLVFAGSIIKYTLLIGETKIIANVINEVDSKLYEVGSEVTAGWDGENMVVLTK